MRGHLPTACTSGVANQRRRSARSILIQRPSSRRWTQSSSCGDFGAAGSARVSPGPAGPRCPPALSSAHHRQWRSSLRHSTAQQAGGLSAIDAELSLDLEDCLGEGDPIALSHRHSVIPARLGHSSLRTVARTCSRNPFLAQSSSTTWNGISGSGTSSGGLRRSPLIGIIAFTPHEVDGICRRCGQKETAHHLLKPHHRGRFPIGQGSVRL